jgi:hypothetical protein
MAETSVRSVEYYYANVPDRPGQAAELLTLLSQAGVDLVGFCIVPSSPAYTQLWIFPSSPAQLLATTKRAGIDLVGPQHAILVQGDNELDALVHMHQSLAEANINVYASSGVTDARGGFGYLLYVRPEDHKKACGLLGIVGAPSAWPPSQRKPTGEGGA